MYKDLVYLVVSSPDDVKKDENREIMEGTNFMVWKSHKYIFRENKEITYPWTG